MTQHADTPHDASPDKGKTPNPEELAKQIEKTHQNDAPKEGNHPPHNHPPTHEPAKHEPAKHEPHKKA